MVDDSKLMRTLVRTHLEAAGFSVVDLEPNSVLDVLKLVRSEQARIVITDYEMPAFTGEMLLRALRSDEKFSEVQVMMLTSHRDPELIVRLVDRGIQAFIPKPLDPAMLVAAVQELLGA